MRFTTEIEGIDFDIEINRDDQYKPFNPLSSFSIQDLDDLREDLIRVYSITVVTTKGEESMKHYTTGVLMSADESEIPEELEDALDDFGIVEHITKQWKINDSNKLTPDWAKVE